MKKHILIVFSLMSVMITGQASYRSKEIIAEDPHWRENQRFHEQMLRQLEQSKPVTQKEELRREPSHIMGVDYNWLDQRRSELGGEGFRLPQLDAKQLENRGSE